MIHIQKEGLPDDLNRKIIFVCYRNRPFAGGSSGHEKRRKQPDFISDRNFTDFSPMAKTCKQEQPDDWEMLFH